MVCAHLPITEDTFSLTDRWLLTVTPSIFIEESLGIPSNGFVTARSVVYRGRIKRCTPSLCTSVFPSVACLEFSWNGKVVEASNSVEAHRWTRVTRKANLRSICQWSRSFETKMQKSFLARIVFENGSIYVKLRTKWATAHSSCIFVYISSAEMLRFVIICNAQSGRTVCRSVHLAVYPHVYRPSAVNSLCLSVVM